MIKLGEKIKTLRRQRGISQEVLAEYLGVTFQAVSKWETGAAMPDVTLIPAIASFFGVSTDELFDFNLYEIEKSVEAIVDEHSRCWDDPARCEALLRDGLKKFPGNVILLNCLVGVIPVPERADEVIDMCKALIAVTKSDEVRLDAYRIMAEAYHSTGETALAKEALEHLPEIYFTKLQMMAILLEGDDRLYGAAKQKVLAFEWLVVMCRILSRHYEDRSEYDKALSMTRMAKEVMLAAKHDVATPYTRTQYDEEWLQDLLDDEARLGGLVG